MTMKTLKMRTRTTQPQETMKLKMMMMRTKAVPTEKRMKVMAKNQIHLSRNVH